MTGDVCAGQVARRVPDRGDDPTSGPTVCTRFAQDAPGSSRTSETQGSSTDPSKTTAQAEQHGCQRGGHDQRDRQRRPAGHGGHPWQVRRVPDWSGGLEPGEHPGRDQSGDRRPEQVPHLAAEPLGDRVSGRLAAGVTLAQAQAEIDSRSARLALS